ncbi:unnamed protein product [Phytophthora fragariaefolia]|uniref:Unnamed protein product n=1 Tax=Phytophthora fragariaefolia TaxID=1490495 RepID=A0A9W6XTY0_9STRA|nr:unnamed protein product [Phytophthora fragariaefolia]
MLAIASAEAFHTAVAASAADGKPLVACFSAPWCGGCKLVAPKVAALAEQLAARADFVGVSAEQLDKLCEAEEVESFPHFRVYRDGKRAGDVTSSKFDKVDAFVRGLVAPDTLPEEQVEGKPEEDAEEQADAEEQEEDTAKEDAEEQAPEGESRKRQERDEVEEEEHVAKKQKEEEVETPKEEEAVVEEVENAAEETAEKEEAVEKEEAADKEEAAAEEVQEEVPAEKSEEQAAPADKLEAAEPVAAQSEVDAAAA